MVSLFCLMVSLSAMDENSSVSQRWLGIAFIIHLLLVPTAASVKPSTILCLQYTNLRCKETCVCVCARKRMKTREYQHRKCTHIHPRLPHHAKHPVILASLKSHINPHTPHTNIQWGMSVPPSNSGGHQCPVKVLTEWLGRHVLLSTPH